MFRDFIIHGIMDENMIYGKLVYCKNGCNIWESTGYDFFRGEGFVGCGDNKCIMILD